MLGRPVNVLRKYCVPETEEAEPSVTDCQLPSEKFSEYQSFEIEESVASIFHCAPFVTG